MRWSGDWSLDVCSSDLMETIDFAAKHKHRHIGVFMLGSEIDCLHAGGARQPDRGMRLLNCARPDIKVAIIVEIGRGSCWERVMNMVVDYIFNKNNIVYL